jgi:manganese oxidase
VTVLDNPPPPTTSEPERSNDSGTPIASLLFFAMAGLLIVLVGAVAVVGIVGLFQSDNGGSGGGAAAAASTTIDVSLTEFAINGSLTAPPGDVTLNVTNNGAQVHNVVLRQTGAKTADLNPNGTASLSLGTLAAGTYELYCDIPGHVESGMVAELVIAEGATTVGGEASGGHGGADGEYDAELMDQKMIDSMLAFPAETEGIGNQILEYELLPDGTKQFELTASIIDWEIEPGKFVEAWAYNGQVPGPTIKTDVGDKVRVIFNNETPLGSDIHWHGLIIPNGQDGVSPYTQDPVPSGGTHIYEFVTEHPAIAMYHAHLHSQISVPNGMFAAFIVGDNPIPYGETISGITIPEDLVVAEEIPMVLNDAGVIGLSLNGKSFPATAPLVLQEGEWAAVHYYNEGLTPHPMHLHGFPQLVYARDGIPLDYPYWADTINVAPGERFSVLFQGTVPGVWVWHCHILTHVESEEGLFGMATAVIVQ